jgi:hypothetical protein
MAIGQRLLAATVAWATLSGGPAHAQTSSLEGAITLYTAASYDEALAALEGARELPLSPADRVELERHQMLCLVALGRTAAAIDAAARLLEQRPDFVLSEGDAAPRVRTMLELTRRRVVPEMIRRTYDDGKRAYDAGEYGRARDVFTQLDAWLADEHVAGLDPRLADLRTLSNGFRELSILGAARQAIVPAAPDPRPTILAARYSDQPWAIASTVPMDRPAIEAPIEESGAFTLGDGSGESGTPPSFAPTVTPAAALAPAVPAAASTEPAPFAPLDIFTFDGRDRDVVPPVAVAQPVSGWWSAMGEPPAGTVLGVLDLVIDEGGRVAEAGVHQSVNRVYDTVLLQSVKQWRYRPATRGGRPVRYRRTTTIVSVGS